MPLIRPGRRSLKLRRRLAAQAAVGAATLLLSGVLAAPEAAVASTRAHDGPVASTSGHPSSASAAGVSEQRGRGARCLRRFDRAVQTYVDTTHSRDVRAFEKLLAPGYTVVLPGGTVFAGRGPSESFIERFFARTDWKQTFEQTSQSVDGCRTGLVVFDSVYTDEDGPAPLVIALTWTYRNGRWLLLTDQNTVKDS